MEEAGHFAPTLPPRGPSSGIDWDAYARQARTQPGTPLLVATAVRESLTKAVRQRRSHDFVNDDGQIVVNTRNGTRVNGVYHGDVYLTWVPNEERTA